MAVKPETTFFWAKTPIIWTQVIRPSKSKTTYNEERRSQAFNTRFPTRLAE